MMHLKRCALAAALEVTALASADARATEGALGRLITGMHIAPFSGLISPDPGFQLSIGCLSYRGEIGGKVPIADDVSLRLEADIDLFTRTGVYIRPTAPGEWNYASMLTVPPISEDDSGPIADRLDGFRGRSLGVGRSAAVHGGARVLISLPLTSAERCPRASD